MKRLIKIIRKVDYDQVEYIRLRLDLDYHLTALHEAIKHGRREERLTLLDKLYDIQQDVNNLEASYPQFKNLSIT